MSVSINFEEKLKWFNQLPLEQKNNAEGVCFQRECPCGKTIWYSFNQVTIEVKSWIENHYLHEKPYIPPISKPYKYDFSQRIKFSKLGFELFKAERNLKPVEDEKVKEIYVDENNLFYVFLPNYEINPITNDVENLYVTFLYLTDKPIWKENQNEQ